MRFAYRNTNASARNASMHSPICMSLPTIPNHGTHTFLPTAAAASLKNFLSTPTAPIRCALFRHCNYTLFTVMTSFPTIQTAPAGKQLCSLPPAPAFSCPRTPRRPLHLRHSALPSTYTVLHPSTQTAHAHDPHHRITPPPSLCMYAANAPFTMLSSDCIPTQPAVLLAPSVRSCPASCHPTNPLVNQFSNRAFHPAPFLMPSQSPLPAAHHNAPQTQTQALAFLQTPLFSPCKRRETASQHPNLSQRPHRHRLPFIIHTHGSGHCLKPSVRVWPVRRNRQPGVANPSHAALLSRRRAAQLNSWRHGNTASSLSPLTQPPVPIETTMRENNASSRATSPRVSLALKRPSARYKSMSSAVLHASVFTQAIVSSDLCV